MTKEEFYKLHRGQVIVNMADAFTIGLVIGWKGKRMHVVDERSFWLDYAVTDAKTLERCNVLDFIVFDNKGLTFDSPIEAKRRAERYRIEATPTLKGKDAERLLADLKDVCTPEEAERRIKYARREVKKMMKPKGKKK